jgi:predicted SAM-dependent methyltransferase
MELAVGAKSSVKRIGKRLAWPVTRRVYGRIDFRAEELHRDFNTLPALIDARTAELEKTIEVLNRHLPTVVNTIASQNAAARQNQRRINNLEVALKDHDGALRGHADSIKQLQERLEFVRREILLEQRYSASAPAAGTPREEVPAAVPSRVVNLARYEEMRGDFRINVGAGHVIMPGYLNVDLRELPGIDITADVHRLPFETGEVSEIYSAHLLEHFPVEELRRSILPYWLSLLEDGGKLVSVVPDVETMVEERAAGRMPFSDFVEVMYGGQEYEGDFHFWGYSKESLTALLEEAGLEDVKVVEEGRRNGLCFEMEIEAVRRVVSPT